MKSQPCAMFSPEGQQTRMSPPSRFLSSPYLPHAPFSQSRSQLHFASAFRDPAGMLRHSWYLARKRLPSFHTFLKIFNPTRKATPRPGQSALRIMATPRSTGLAVPCFMTAMVTIFMNTFQSLSSSTCCFLHLATTSVTILHSACIRRWDAFVVQKPPFDGLRSPLFGALCDGGDGGDAADGQTL